MTPIIIWAIGMSISLISTAIFLRRNGEFANFKKRGK